MINPDIKQNPHPVKRYEITMTIEGAPGPFESVTGKMGYEITNPLCWPQDPVSGARPTPSEDPPIVFARVSDNVYKGIVYLDLLQDEDYYGLGVCHWKMTDAFMSLRAHAVTFGHDITFNEIVSEKSVIRYFSNRSYFDKNLERSDFGNPSRTDFGSESTNTFSITLETKEILP